MDKTTAFGLPLFYRVVVPGGVAALLALPLLVRVLPQLGVRPADATTGVIVFVLVVGFVLEALDDWIYKVYEGLRLWPPAVRKWRTASWQSLVDRLRQQDQQAGADGVTRGAIWAELLDFPFDEGGRPYAARPTRLGNIIAAYESYPYERYGLDATVYWPRLWVSLPNDVRESVEQDGAFADSLLHAAASFGLVGVAYIFTGSLSLLAAAGGLLFIFDSSDVRWVAFFGGFELLLLSYVPYYLSIGPQHRYGEVFRSVFDMYRGNLNKVALANAEEWKRSDDLGDALLYAPRPKQQEASAGESTKAPTDA